MLTTASGDYSHTQGYNTKVDVNCDGGFASGESTQVSARYAFTHGYHVTSSQNNQVVFGKNNYQEEWSSNNTSSLVVGAGDAQGTTKLNALKAGHTWDGENLGVPFIKIPVSKSDNSFITTADYGLVGIPEPGFMFYNTNDNHLYIRTNGSWKSASFS